MNIAKNMELPAELLASDHFMADLKLVEKKLQTS